MIFLTLEELTELAHAVVDGEVKIRDPGLLGAAVARPQTTVFGEDAYPTLADKAAALLHSIVRNHALIDGNKRLAFAAAILFCALNGHYPRFGDDEAYDMVIRAATGEFDVADVAASFRKVGVP
ncbi:type II toxin-antitoxin system death-on-curing family toxin [Planosporangium flavigriseum]|uniref:Toxin Doc n=1 Tax=Planosporangium flavigriseum TaxID=373681 RepID=A0A8J3LPX6_9ACTN|nr:type II toxin-antitoxin system death-on-curing family toxin [Planosporangium flavigriseum]NJC67128.1 type II toxin-antitoxin system death-on-curing family toxin [Planosporangium flavigriseum]GIG75757.1 toxin Doc [Planosporangium flavigriseum]